MRQCLKQRLGHKPLLPWWWDYCGWNHCTYDWEQMRVIASVFCLLLGFRRASPAALIKGNRCLSTNRKCATGNGLLTIALRVVRITVRRQDNAPWNLVATTPKQKNILRTGLREQVTPNRHWND